MTSREFKALRNCLEFFCSEMYRRGQNPLPYIRKILGIDIKYFEGNYPRFPGYQFTRSCVALRDLRTEEVWIKFPSFYFEKRSSFKKRKDSLFGFECDEEDDELYTK